MYIGYLRIFILIKSNKIKNTKKKKEYNKEKKKEIPVYKNNFSKQI